MKIYNVLVSHGDAEPTTVRIKADGVDNDKMSGMEKNIGEMTFTLDGEVVGRVNRSVILGWWIDKK